MSEYKQTSFNGGINLLLDDTRLPVLSRAKEGDSPYDVTFNQYRFGRNIRTRFDVCSPVLASVEDVHISSGIKQAIVSFGNYVICFVAGKAYYRLSTDVSWTNIPAFSMSTTAPRYWTVAVPLSETNYGRLGGTTSGSVVSANLPITQINIVAGAYGTLPGLLVQDGINQPQFIFIDVNGFVQCRKTQSYEDWSFPIDSGTLQLTGPDKREYVPIGTYMEVYNGMLFIVDPTFNYLYRSVTGRPLDFVINVDKNGQKGGDASTTSYSVGVGGITAIKALPGDILFVAASGIGFAVTRDQSNVAVKIFGEWTFNRQTLFKANCVTDVGITDALGDPVFIDINGIRQFSSAETFQQGGKNSIFSSSVQSLFTGIKQGTMVNSSSIERWCSVVNFEDYIIFSMNTVVGYALIVYDNINKCFSSLDMDQVENTGVKQFALIDTDISALYAITGDNKLYQLYSSSSYNTGLIRLGSVCEQDPKKELKVVNVRAIVSNMTADCTITCTLFVNNRYSNQQSSTLKYIAPSTPYTGVPIGPDVGTQTNNVLFSIPNSQQGWKAFVVLSWTGGATLVSASISTTDQTPMQPIHTQAVISQQ